ncbi:MAG: hypothetical protein KatS3mg099_287 [Candidatus Parcubacteria bacterium]|nr:MAG: hypothetical protein KatS3mg099_287 [Candidatus Parcubacteria bacterium]
MAVKHSATDDTNPTTRRNAWKPGYERLASASYANGVWRVMNVRTNHYDPTLGYPQAEEEAQPRWAERAIREEDIAGAYFLHTRFSRFLAHDFLTFDIAGDRPIAVSKEIRYTPHYEWTVRRLALNTIRGTDTTCVIVAEEFDVMYLRTHIRQGEFLYAYPLALSREQARALFRSVMQSLAKENDPNHPIVPRNPLRQSCSGFALGHLANVPGAPAIPRWHYGRWLTAYADRLLARLGLLRGVSRWDEQTSERFLINSAVQTCGQDEAYSLCWRQAIGAAS